jgi:putative ATPase
MEPLASRIRPQTLAEFVGQEHLVGRGKPLAEAIKKKHLFSFILWGPPGVGKTTLARIYAHSLGTQFYELSAVSAGKADIKKIVDDETNEQKVLFLDEIHRFNKAQQDYLLPFVESGEITLIGATTENPSFEVIAPLLSRCRVFVLEELTPDAMEAIVKRTRIKLDARSREWLIRVANGDARQALTLLESTVSLYRTANIESMTEALQSTYLRYDKRGDEHYNSLSAFIKSMRASDPDAALYYLARMVLSGEDPKLIARRMVVFASEDIGMALPTALVVANEVFRACETIGYPECAINLAHGVIYLATAKKDRGAYKAFRMAQADVRLFGNLPIPLELRNAPTKLMEELRYGEGYENYPKGKSLLPEKLKKKKYYRQ